MSSLAPMQGRLRTRCSQCSHEFYIGPSLAMQMGMNTGHAGCPKCRAFLHIEVLEGDVAWSELHSTWLEKINNQGPSLVQTITSVESDGVS